jgi:hypothetical protein
LELEFREGEEVILENAGFSQNVVLTNMRIIFAEKKGWLKVYFRVKEEISLEQIEEAYTHTIGDVVQTSVAMLKMKDGQERRLGVGIGFETDLGSFLAVDGASDNAIKTKALSDRWVNAINQQLRKKVEDRTQKLEERIRELEEKLKEK